MCVCPCASVSVCVHGRVTVTMTARARELVLEDGTREQGSCLTDGREHMAICFPFFSSFFSVAR